MAFFQPPDGMLGTDAIAKDVALRYLREVFPEDDHLEPLTTSLENGVWKFHGYLEKGAMGGVAYIELCQSNGRVLTVYHTQ